MRTIEMTATITADGTLTLQVPSDIRPGDHQAVLVIDEQPMTREKRLPLKFSAYAVGLVSEGMTLRREDIYGDDGR